MFDVHQSIYNQHGEHDERRVGEYIDGLMREFEGSPEARPVIDQYDGLGWAATMMEYAFGHLGVPIPKMSLRDFEEVVFGLIPRKVSTEADSAAATIDELRAFWAFLHRQYGLANARKILDSLTPGSTARLHQALSDPANFGMAKSFVMQGMKAGYDMTTQEGLNAFMLEYNSRLLGGLPQLPGLPPGYDPGPPGDDYGYEVEPGPLSHSPKERAEERKKKRKAQRQARKRHRR